MNAGAEPLYGGEREEIEQFLFEEARLADESRYSEWEALLDEDMVYWVPLGDGNYDPEQHMSITRDNRARLGNRILQLTTGRRYAQTPPSPMRRMLSNIVVRREQNGEYSAACNFVLYELRLQSTNHLQVWPGRIHYKLRRKDRGLKMFFKKIVLVNGNIALPGLAFLL